MRRNQIRCRLDRYWGPCCSDGERGGEPGVDCGRRLIHVDRNRGERQPGDGERIGREQLYAGCERRNAGRPSGGDGDLYRDGNRCGRQGIRSGHRNGDRHSGGGDGDDCGEPGIDCGG